MIFSTRAFKRPRVHPRAMAARSGDPTLLIVFGKAFLLELRRGNLAQACLFAKALLAHSVPERLISAAPFA